MDRKGDEIRHSISASSINSTTHNENKYSKMKKVISAIESYLETRAEDKAILINQYLQALSLSLDLTIFDPHTNIAGKFFISIYDLMNILESRSLTSWYCVDVLLNACKNDTARRSLMKTYHFLPCLARLIGDQLTTDKKTRLLRLMQDITCGIKMHWQIPHMTHLMCTLCRWIERQELDVITLSLGVLVNLCYKNVTNIYIFQRNVDLKKFIRMILALKGTIVEVYVCQMMIILENISCYVPTEVLPKLIDSTFIAIIEAYRKRDSILLKQIVEFFTDNLKNNCNNQFNCYNMYGERVGNILEIIATGNDSVKDPECLSVVLDLIHCLIEIKVPQISSLYTQIIPLTLEWIQESTVSYQALAVLRTIAVKVDRKENKILESLIVGLPMFLLVLNSVKDEGFVFHSEYNKRLGALLQLLTAMIQVKTIRANVVKELHEDIFTKILFPLLGDNSPRSSEHTCSTDAVNLYVYALALVGELVECDKSWTTFMNNLLRNKQIQVILAQAICQSPLNVKTLALELSSKSCADGVSLALSNLQSIISPGSESCNHVGSPSPNEFGFSLIPVKQNERLDSILDNVETLVGRNEIGNLATSELMELYNYKLSHLAQAERAALASVEAATKYCSHLQHRIGRLTSEHTRLQQAEFFIFQKLEELKKKKEEMNLANKDLQNRIEAERGKYKACHSQLLIKEKALGECEVSLKDTEYRLQEMIKNKNNLAEQLSKLQHIFNKVEENGKRYEKIAQKNDELLKHANETITNYSKQVKDLEKCLAEKQKQLDDTTAALQLKSSILESITKMANSQL